MFSYIRAYMQSVRVMLRVRLDLKVRNAAFFFSYISGMRLMNCQNKTKAKNGVQGIGEQSPQQKGAPVTVYHIETRDERSRRKAKKLVFIRVYTWNLEPRAWNALTRQEKKHNTHIMRALLLRVYVVFSVLIGVERCLGNPRRGFFWHVASTRETASE